MYAQPFASPYSQGYAFPFFGGSGGGGYTRDQVFARAGITPGIYPGVRDQDDETVDGVVGEDYSYLTGTSFAVLNGAGANLLIENEADAIAIDALHGDGTGDGSEANPYLIKNKSWYAPLNAAPHLTIDSPGTSFWVKCYGCAIDFGKASNHLFSVDAGTGGLIMEHCSIKGQGMSYSDSWTQFNVLSGTMRFLRCLHSYLRSSIAWSHGTTIESFHCQCDPTLGAAAGYALFQSKVAGGSLLVSQFTHIPTGADLIFSCNKNWSVTLDRVRYNPTAIAIAGRVIQFHSTSFGEPWNLGFTATNCLFVAGSSSVSMVGFNDPNDANVYQFISNVTFQNCTFYRPVLPASTVRMISIGKNAGTYPDVPTNINFKFCRFMDPWAVQKPAGYEILEMFRCVDVLVEGCWTEGAGEDAYEFVTPIRNNIVRYSGGGGGNGVYTPGVGMVAGGSVVNGNMVDFYAAYGAPTANAAWRTSTGNLGGHEAHHIWGVCGSDGISVDCVNHVRVHHTNGLDNSAGGFGANPPACNVRLHSRSSSGAGSLEGVVVTGPLASVSESFQGFPCLLTMEQNSATTVAGTASGGQAIVNVVDGSLFAAGHQVRVTLASPASTYHYTTVFSKNVNELTLADDLPSDSALNARVERQSVCVTGNVSWYDGVSATLDGTTWVVNGAAS